MDERVNSITVVLAHDMRPDDVDPLLTAIAHLRGVLSVKCNVSDPLAFLAEQRARNELGARLWNVIHPGAENALRLA